MLGAKYDLNDDKEKSAHLTAFFTSRESYEYSLLVTEVLLLVLGLLH